MSLASTLESPTRLRADERADPALDAALLHLERELIGLTDAKARLRAILMNSMTARARVAIGSTSAPAPLHMLFTGNAGTGKTIFAQKLAELLYRLDYLHSNRLTVAAWTELTGQYPGHAAGRARQLIERARGGVLFIDDAYNLNRPETSEDFGREAIDVLTGAAQDRDSGLVVILAGDAAKMDALFDDAPRLRACIAQRLHFPDYTGQELLAIAETMLREMQFELDPAARAGLAEYLGHRIRLPHFANARTVRHALDRARLRQSSRLFAQSLAGLPLDAADLVRIEGADLPALQMHTVQAVPAAMPPA
jgi:AAA+ superfamily predicted ATPase